MDMLLSLAAALLAYLIGSLSFAVIVSRSMGLADPRSYGSKNPGATNVLRSGSKAAAIATLVLDALKATVPVLLVKAYGPDHGMGDGTVALVAIGAFLGHLWPVFFKFEGGKGVATALGALLALSWPLGLATALTWLIIAYFFRYSSLAAIVAAVFAPVYYLLLGGIAWSLSKPIALSITLMSLLLIYRHRENIGRLMSGKETKLGKKN
jgi:acyl phosphate:glycerol-3-phosphate acyltransferase